MRNKDAENIQKIVL